MKPESSIIANGGWVTQQSVGRLRARAFGVLSLAWLGIALWGSHPFWSGWPQPFGGLEWWCLALVVPEPVFVILAVVFWRTEKPRIITEYRANPNYDPRNLY